MAILRNAEGKFFEVDDKLLEGKQVKPENLPKELQEGGARPPGSGGGDLAGLIQVIVNMPSGGGAGVGAGAPQEGGAAGKREEDDVVGHSSWWRNSWRNCWRNYQWQNW